MIQISILLYGGIFEGFFSECISLCLRIRYGKQNEQLQHIC